MLSKEFRKNPKIPKIELSAKNSSNFQFRKSQSFSSQDFSKSLKKLKNPNLAIKVHPKI
jgi:hypothetical protein